MSNLISRAVATVNSLFNRLQAKQLLSFVLVAFVLLASNIDAVPNNQALEKRVDQLAHQEDSQRPKTTGEWNRQARETKDAPGERAKRIGKQSAEAVKDFGALYPDTAQRSASEIGSNNQ